jgi:pimeloyl-ACP methyl ester carboxylesterase
MVLIHGVGLRAEAWGALIPLLQSTFTLHLLDMPGHGASALCRGEQLGDYTARFADYLDRLGGAITVGHSMGAMIALDLAGRAPGLLHGVAALNAIYRRSPEAAQQVQARAQAQDGTALPDPAPTLRRWFSDLDTPPARACRDWLTDVDPRGYAQAYRVFAHHDGPDQGDLAAYPGPALFITGGDEPNSTPRMSQDMARLAPCGTAHVIDGAAHMAPMTHPRIIADLISRQFATKEIDNGH